MSEPFLGEIKIFANNYAPRGWALCNGQQLPINQNQALFSLLGTTYGGNGQTTFALPDLRGRIPMHRGAGHSLGEAGGQSSHTLTPSELPQHSHVVNAASINATTSTPNPPNTVGSARANQSIYGPPANFVAMSPLAVGNVGGSQPHENMQPYLVLTFGIALVGIFPSQN